MDLSNTEVKATEHFDFGASAADLLASGHKRNVRNEVMGKGMDPQATIDAFEIAKGIKKKPKGGDMGEYTFKNMILDPGTQLHQDMLNELMNNKKYMIAMWKDTWTALGEFRVFVIYGEKKETAPPPVNK